MCLGKAEINSTHGDAATLWIPAPVGAELAVNSSITARLCGAAGLGDYGETSQAPAYLPHISSPPKVGKNMFLGFF